MTDFSVSDQDLLEWSGEELEPDPEQDVQLANWLIRGQSPEIRHKILEEWNWDFGHELICWVLSQPDCDIATVKLAYWLSSPQYYASLEVKNEVVPSVNAEGALLTKWIAGLFATDNTFGSAIAFQVPKWIENEIKEYGLTRDAFPREAWVETNGIDVSEIEYPENAPVQW